MLLFHGDHFHGITDRNRSRLEDAGEDSTVTAHGVVSASSEVLLHSGARVAITGELENGLSDSESAIPKRLQIYSSDDNIPAGQVRVDRVHAKNGCNGRQVLRLDQRDLALPARAPRVVVAVKSRVGTGEDRCNGIRGLKPLSTDSDPLNGPGLSMRHQQWVQRRILVHYQ